MYFDESGFASDTHRPHGWAIRGRKVFGRISGKHHSCSNLIMAQRGSDWLAPMLFEASCTHLTVTTWIEKMLLPALLAKQPGHHVQRTIPQYVQNITAASCGGPHADAAAPLLTRF